MPDNSRGKPRLKRSERFVFWIAGIVILTIFLNLLLALLADQGTYLPAQVELPLSDMGDFVEAPDGTILVQVSLFQRIQRYSADGHYLESWNGVPSRIGLISATQDGDLIACLGTSLIVYDRKGKLIDLKDTHLKSPVTWIYLGDRNFEPRRVARPGTSKTLGLPPATPVPSRQLEPGEAVCTHGAFEIYGLLERKEATFDRLGGGQLIREGDRIHIVDSEGRREGTVATPWYFWWLKLFWPSVPLGLLSAVAVLVIDRRASRRAEQVD